MNLRDWIVEIGEERAAKVLREKRRTVRSWRFGERSPSPKKAASIVKRTHGAVSFAGCYGHESGSGGEDQVRAEAS